MLLRADMDGLPLEERSGLPNASRVRQTDAAGTEQPVMHACGHDVHITALVGTARQMAARRANWSGTLVLIAQPAEETISGARAMIQDGLYTRFPKPDYAVAFHVAAEVPAGRIDVPRDDRQFAAPIRSRSSSTASARTAPIRIWASIRCWSPPRSSSRSSRWSAATSIRSRAR